ncbi:MAG TPA: GIY-YIG nuclease family protein [Polyangiaceae bacterium]|jgi:hypothetical protein
MSVYIRLDPEVAHDLFNAECRCQWCQLYRLRTPTWAREDYVYFLQEGVDGPIKIGHGRCPDRRLRGCQSGNPRELRLLGYRPGYRRDERTLHLRFKRLRIRGEWFQPADELLAFIKETIRHA